MANRIENIDRQYPRNKPQIGIIFRFGPVVDIQSLPDLTKLYPLCNEWIGFIENANLRSSIEAQYADLPGQCLAGEFDPHREEFVAFRQNSDWLLFIDGSCVVELSPQFNTKKLDSEHLIYWIKSHNVLGMAQWQPLLVYAGGHQLPFTETFKFAQEPLRTLDHITLYPNSQWSIDNAKQRAATAIIEASEIDELVSLGQAYEAFGDCDAAWDCYQKISENERESRENRWLAYYRMADIARRAQPNNERVASLNASALDIWPQRIESIIRLAECFRVAKDWDRQKQFLDLVDDEEIPADQFFFDYVAYRRVLPKERMEQALYQGDHEETIRQANRYLNRYHAGEEALQVMQIRDKSYQILHPLLPVNYLRENHFVIIVAFRNAGTSLQRCIDSIKQQSYKRFRVIFIDDCSTDHASNEANFDGLRHDLIHNQQRKGALQNQYEALMAHRSPDDIAVFVDGDDQLADEHVLSKLNALYNQSDCWVTYGQFKMSEKDGCGYARPILPDEDFSKIINGDAPLQFPIHLRSHRVGLFHRIADQDAEFTCLKNSHGEFIPHASDVAHMRAMMMLAGWPRIRYIPDILYIYNCNNPLSHHTQNPKGLAEDCIHIASMPALEPVQSYRPQAEIHLSRHYPNPTRILIIGLEGVEPNIIDAMEAKGELPHISKCLGSKTQITPARGFGNDVFWRSIYSGKSVGQIRQVFRSIERRYSYEYDNFFAEGNGDEFEGFWEELGLRGHRIAVLNPSEIKIRNTTNVTSIAQWLPHAPINLAHCNPEKLYEVLHDKPEIYSLYEPTDRLSLVSPEECQGVLDHVLKRQQVKGELYRKMLKQGGWDLFFCMFDSIHDVSHSLWHFHDPQSYAYQDIHSNPVLDSYRELDKQIGEMLTTTGDVPICLIAGMGVRRSGSFNSQLDQFLIALEKSYTGESVSQEKSERLFYQLVNNPISGAVRVNLQERQPNGKVALDNYKNFVAKLAEDLLKIKDRHTGQPAIEEVIIPSQEYSGPYLAELPDLLLLWHPDARSFELESDYLKLTRFSASISNCLDFRTGDHHDSAALYTNQLFDQQVTLPSKLQGEDLANIFKQFARGTPVF